MAEANIPEIFAGQRVGHQVPAPRSPLPLPLPLPLLNLAPIRAAQLPAPTRPLVVEGPVLRAMCYAREIAFAGFGKESLQL